SHVSTLGSAVQGDLASPTCWKKEEEAPTTPVCSFVRSCDIRIRVLNFRRKLWGIIGFLT
ncbi:hypothetical protein SK128_019346, partial [Halocaridina rubra]